MKRGAEQNQEQEGINKKRLAERMNDRAAVGPLARSAGGEEEQEEVETAPTFLLLFVLCVFNNSEEEQTERKKESVFIGDT